MFELSAWVLILLAAFWLVDIFVFERIRLRRLDVAVAQGTLKRDADAIALLRRRPWTHPLQVVGLPLIVVVIYSAMQANRDLALLLILGTLFAGLVALLDLILMRPVRRRIAAALVDEDAVRHVQTDSTVVEYSRTFFPVLALVVVIRSFLFEPYQIPSESMRPTLLVGDFLLVNKFSYGFRLPVIKTQLTDFGNPQPGEVIVFTPPHRDNQNYIKRVVATGGDHVRYDYQSRDMWVNGELIERVFLSERQENGRVVRTYEETLGDYSYDVYQIENSPAPNWPALDTQVPEGHYFVVGDNRDNSLDSRFWEPQYGTSPFVDGRELQGKAVLRWMYWPSLFSLPSFSRFGPIH